MKKISILFVTILSLFNVCYSQSSDWQIYNVIPYYKDISLYFDKNDVHTLSDAYDGLLSCNDYNNYSISLIIHDDYSVSFEYSTHLFYVVDYSTCERTTAPYTITGNGVLLWKNDKMVLQLNIKEYTAGWYDYKDIKITTSHYSYLLGMDVERTDPGHVICSISKYEKQYTINYDVIFIDDNNGQSFLLKGSDISSTIRGTREKYNDKTLTSIGNYSFYYKTKICLTDKRFVFSANQKSESELNAENSDIYGKWQWNEDRSKIYLSSMTDDSYMVLWNNKNNLEWGFTLPDSSCGYKTEETAKGENLEYLMISFDGSSEQSFIFNTYYYDIMQFDDSSEGSSSIDSGYFYENVQYDRFSGKLKRNASILGQIKDKRIMVVNYKQNGLDKTAMFQLEGLEAIYNALTEEDE